MRKNKLENGETVKISLKERLKNNIYITGILLIIIGILIYWVSPIITEAIQNAAFYISELESEYITRFVELALGILILLVSLIVKKESEE